MHQAIRREETWPKAHHNHARKSQSEIRGNSTEPGFPDSAATRSLLLRGRFIELSYETGIECTKPASFAGE